jgi:hypothetical protein
VKRIDAANAGLTRYSSGKPCRAGHISDRYTSTGNCIACQTSVRKRLNQARIGNGLGWSSITTQVPPDHVATLRDFVSILRRMDPRAAYYRDQLRELLHDLQVDDPIGPADCLEVVAGPPVDPARAKPPGLLPVPDNGEPADWHRDEGYRSLIPPAFRGGQ